MSHPDRQPIARFLRRVFGALVLSALLSGCGDPSNPSQVFDFNNANQGPQTSNNNSRVLLSTDVISGSVVPENIQLVNPTREAESLIPSD